MIKKVFIIFVLLLVFQVSVAASVNTGHDDLSEITFIDGGQLLVNISETTMERWYDEELSRKVFGWSTYYHCVNKKISFIGDVIFSRANATSVGYTFNYYLKEVESSERSVNYTGSIAGKLKGKIKTVDLQLDGQIEKKIGKKDTITKTEETTLHITVRPNTKITLQIAGEGVLSNGASAYYFLGIRFKKGCWEYVDVETKYYELIEEVYQ